MVDGCGSERGGPVRNKQRDRRGCFTEIDRNLLFRYSSTIFCEFETVTFSTTHASKCSIYCHNMIDDTRRRILNVFKEYSGYARTRDIRSRGIHHKYLQELLEEGSIIKLRHGLYSLAEIDNYAVLYEALLTVPDGIICMGTALAYYELTTWNPSDIHIAITRGRKVALPDYPPIQLYHISADIISIGITEIEIERGKPIRIYDKERTVCDAVRFRNRLGIDIMKESLSEYLKRRDKDLNRLTTYAKKLKISSVLNQYLEVLI